MSDSDVLRALNDRLLIDDEMLAFLSSTDSPTITNAIEELSLRPPTEGFVGGNVRAQFPELGPMVGRALTVKMTDARDADPGRANYWRMWSILEEADVPVVLVFVDETGSPQRVAYAGEVMSTLAKRLGAVGMITDGALRDVQEVRRLGFHYFMRFPVVSHGDFEVAAVGEPVALDGQRILTGDLLHGDENGVVVVPDRALPDLSVHVDRVLAREKTELELINSPGFTLDKLRPAHSY